MKKILFAALFFLAVGQTMAQDQYEIMKAEYDSLLAAGNKREALAISKTMNQWASENEGDTSLRYAVSFRYIGCANKNKDTALFYFNLSNSILVKQNRRDHVEYGISCAYIGDCYLDKDDPVNAIKYYREAENVIRQSLGENSNGYLSVILSLYEIYKNYHYYDESNKCIIKAYDLIVKNDLLNSEIYQAILKEIDVLIYKETIHGISLVKKNENVKAEEQFMQIKNIFTTVNDTISLKFADLCTNIGLNYFYTGKYSLAKQFLNKAKNIYEINNQLDNNGYATTLNNLGIVYMQLNDYINAEMFFKKALLISYNSHEKFNNNKFLLQSNLGVIYLNLSNYELAKNCFYSNLILANNSKSDKSKNYALSCLNISAAYKGENNIDSAIFYIEKAIKYYEKNNEYDSNLGLAYNNLGVVYLDKKEYDKASYVLKKAVDNLNNANLSNINYYALALTNLGVVYDELRKYDLSQYYLDTAYYIITKNNLDADQNLYCQGALAWHSKKFDKLYSIYDYWLNIKTRKLLKDFTYLSTKEKMNYWNHENKVFYDILNFSPIAYSEMPKLSELSYNSLLLLKSLLVDNEQDFIHALRIRNDTNSIISYNKIKKLKDDLNSVEYATNKTYLEPLKAQIDSINKLLVLQVGEYASLKRRFEMRWKDVRNSLQPNEAAIEFSRYYDEVDTTYKYMVQVLRQNYEYPHIVKLAFEKEIEKVTAGNGLSELYHLVWEPIDSLLQGVQTVYYAPDGRLHSVPFHALCIDDTAGCTYLMDQYTLHRLSTTRYLADSSLIKPKTLNPSIALYGGIRYDVKPDTLPQPHEESNEDFLLAYTLKREMSRGAAAYLPGSKAEVETIAPMLNSRQWTTSITTGKEASENNFKALSDTSSPSIIHIATHGFAFPEKEEKKKSRLEMMSLGNEQNRYSAADDPMLRCGLMFAGANRSWTGQQQEIIAQTGEDGILTAAEVANMNLSNTKLVVLSACETGLGKIEGSEGVFGLQRGFKLAGVEQLIVSLWKVPDHETMELMNLFYTDLTITKDPVISFSKAQKQMRNNYPDNPEKWAGFVMVR